MATSGGEGRPDRYDGSRPCPPAAGILIQSVLQAVCKKAGRPDKMAADLEALPAELEWGQVLVSLRAVPVSPADLHTIQTGGSYGGSRRQPPFVIGHDGVGVVMQVRSRGLCNCAAQHMPKPYDAVFTLQFNAS